MKKLKSLIARSGLATAPAFVSAAILVLAATLLASHYAHPTDLLLPGLFALVFLVVFFRRLIDNQNS